MAVAAGPEVAPKAPVETPVAVAEKFLKELKDKIGEPPEARKDLIRAGVQKMTKEQLSALHTKITALAKVPDAFKEVFKDDAERDLILKLTAQQLEELKKDVKSVSKDFVEHLKKSDTKDIIAMGGVAVVGGYIAYKLAKFAFSPIKSTKNFFKNLVTHPIRTIAVTGATAFAGVAAVFFGAKYIERFLQKAGIKKIEGASAAAKPLGGVNAGKTVPGASDPEKTPSLDKIDIDVSGIAAPGEGADNAKLANDVLGANSAIPKDKAPADQIKDLQKKLAEAREGKAAFSLADAYRLQARMELQMAEGLDALPGKKNEAAACRMRAAYCEIYANAIAKFGELQQRYDSIKALCQASGVKLDDKDLKRDAAIQSQFNLVVTAARRRMLAGFGKNGNPEEMAKSEAELWELLKGPMDDKGGVDITKGLPAFEASIDLLQKRYQKLIDGANGKMPPEVTNADAILSDKNRQIVEWLRANGNEDLAKKLDKKQFILRPDPSGEEDLPAGIKTSFFELPDMPKYDRNKGPVDFLSQFVVQQRDLNAIKLNEKGMVKLFEKVFKDPNAYAEYVKYADVLKTKKEALAEFKGNGKANVASLVDLQMTMAAYQGDRFNLALLRSRFTKGAPGAPDVSVWKATPEELKKQYDAFFLAQQKDSAGRFNAHLGMVEEKVLKAGAIDKVEDLWNKEGRPLLTQFADMITDLQTFWIPSKIPGLGDAGLSDFDPKKAAKEHLMGELPKLLGWPRYTEGPKAGQLKDQKDFTKDERQAMEAKQVSVIDCIKKFREAGNEEGKGTHFENMKKSVALMQDMTSEANQAQIQAWLEEGDGNIEIPASLEGVHVTSVAEIPKIAEANGCSKAAVIMHCCEQLMIDTAKYHDSYRKLLEGFHDVIGLHMDWENAFESFAGKQLQLMLAWLLILGVAVVFGKSIIKGGIKMTYRSAKFGLRTATRAVLPKGAAPKAVPGVPPKGTPGTFKPVVPKPNPTHMGGEPGFKGGFKTGAPDISKEGPIKVNPAPKKFEVSVPKTGGIGVGPGTSVFTPKENFAPGSFKAPEIGKGLPSAPKAPNISAKPGGMLPKAPRAGALLGPAMLVGSAYLDYRSYDEAVEQRKQYMEAVKNHLLEAGFKEVPGEPNNFEGYGTKIRLDESIGKNDENAALRSGVINTAAGAGSMALLWSMPAAPAAAAGAYVTLNVALVVVAINAHMDMNESRELMMKLDPAIFAFLGPQLLIPGKSVYSLLDNYSGNPFLTELDPESRKKTAFAFFMTEVMKNPVIATEVLGGSLERENVLKFYEDFKEIILPYALTIMWSQTKRRSLDEVLNLKMTGMDWHKDAFEDGMKRGLGLYLHHIREKRYLDQKAKVAELEGKLPKLPNGKPDSAYADQWQFYYQEKLKLQILGDQESFGERLNVTELDASKGTRTQQLIAGLRAPGGPLGLPGDSKAPDGNSDVWKIPPGIKGFPYGEMLYNQNISSVASHLRPHNAPTLSLRATMFELCVDLGLDLPEDGDTEQDLAARLSQIVLKEGEKLGTMPKWQLFAKTTVFDERGKKNDIPVLTDDPSKTFVFRENDNATLAAENKDSAYAAELWKQKYNVDLHGPDVVPLRRSYKVIRTDKPIPSYESPDAAPKAPAGTSQAQVYGNIELPPSCKGIAFQQVKIGATEFTICHQLIEGIKDGRPALYLRRTALLPAQGNIPSSASGTAESKFVQYLDGPKPKPGEKTAAELGVGTPPELLAAGIGSWNTEGVEARLKTENLKQAAISQTSKFMPVEGNLWACGFMDADPASKGSHYLLQIDGLATGAPVEATIVRNTKDGPQTEQITLAKGWMMRRPMSPQVQDNIKQLRSMMIRPAPFTPDFLMHAFDVPAEVAATNKDAIETLRVAFLTQDTVKSLGLVVDLIGLMSEPELLKDPAAWQKIVAKEKLPRGITSISKQVIALEKKLASSKGIEPCAAEMSALQRMVKTAGTTVKAAFNTYYLQEAPLTDERYKWKAWIESPGPIVLKDADGMECELADDGTLSLPAQKEIPAGWQTRISGIVKAEAEDMKAAFGKDAEGPYVSVLPAEGKSFPLGAQKQLHERLGDLGKDLPITVTGKEVRIYGDFTKIWSDAPLEAQRRKFLLFSIANCEQQDDKK